MPVSSVKRQYLAALVGAWNREMASAYDFLIFL